MQAQSWRPVDRASINTIASLTGLDFIELSGSIFRSAKRATEDQKDVLRYLRLNEAVRMQIMSAADGASGSASFAGLAQINKVDPYALQVCKDDIRYDVRRNLAAARRPIEILTRQEWELNRASLTTRAPTLPRTGGHRGVDFFGVLGRLEELSLIRLDTRDNDIVAIVAASRKLGDHVSSGFKPTAFRPSEPHKIYDFSAIGPLNIFSNGHMRRGWKLHP